MLETGRTFLENETLHLSCSFYNSDFAMLQKLPRDLLVPG